MDSFEFALAAERGDMETVTKHVKRKTSNPSLAFLVSCRAETLDIVERLCNHYIFSESCIRKGVQLCTTSRAKGVLKDILAAQYPVSGKFEDEISIYTDREKFTLDILKTDLYIKIARDIAKMPYIDAAVKDRLSNVEFHKDLMRRRIKYIRSNFFYIPHILKNMREIGPKFIYEKLNEYFYMTGMREFIHNFIAAYSKSTTHKKEGEGRQLENLHEYMDNYGLSPQISLPIQWFMAAILFYFMQKVLSIDEYKTALHMRPEVFNLIVKIQLHQFTMNDTHDPTKNWRRQFKMRYTKDQHHKFILTSEHGHFEITREITKFWRSINLKVPQKVTFFNGACVHGNRIIVDEIINLAGSMNVMILLHGYKLADKHGKFGVLHRILQFPQFFKLWIYLEIDPGIRKVTPIKNFIQNTEFRVQSLIGIIRYSLQHDTHDTFEQLIISLVSEKVKRTYDRGYIIYKVLKYLVQFQKIFLLKQFLLKFSTVIKYRDSIFKKAILSGKVNILQMLMKTQHGQHFIYNNIRKSAIEYAIQSKNVNMFTYIVDMWGIGVQTYNALISAVKSQSNRILSAIYSNNLFIYTMENFIDALNGLIDKGLSGVFALDKNTLMGIYAQIKMRTGKYEEFHGDLLKRSMERGRTGITDFLIREVGTGILEDITRGVYFSYAQDIFKKGVKSHTVIDKEFIVNMHNYRHWGDAIIDRNIMFMYALEMNNSAAVYYTIISPKTNPNYIKHDEKVPLFLNPVLWKKCKESILIVLNAPRTNINAYDNRAMYLAVNTGNVEAQNVLFERIQNFALGMRSIIKVIIKKGYIRLLNLLLSKAPKLGDYAMQASIESGNHAVFFYLLPSNAARRWIRGKLVSDLRWLHIAMQSKSPEIVTYILSLRLKRRRSIRPLNMFTYMWAIYTDCSVVINGILLSPAKRSMLYSYHNVLLRLAIILQRKHIIQSLLRAPEIRESLEADKIFIDLAIHRHIITGKNMIAIVKSVINTAEISLERNALLGTTLLVAIKNPPPVNIQFINKTKELIEKSKIISTGD